MFPNFDLLLRPVYLGFTLAERRQTQPLDFAFRFHGLDDEGADSDSRYGTEVSIELSHILSTTGAFFSALSAVLEHHRFTTIERLAAVASDIAQEHYTRNPGLSMGTHGVDVVVKKLYAYPLDPATQERPVHHVEFRYFDKDMDDEHCYCPDLPYLSLCGIKLPSDLVSGLLPGELTLDLTVVYPHEPIACYTDNKDHVYLDHRELYAQVQDAVAKLSRKPSVGHFAEELAASVLYAAPVQEVHLDFKVHREEGAPVYRSSVKPDLSGNVLPFRLLSEFHLVKSHQKDGLPIPLLFDDGYVAKVDMICGRVSLMPPAEYIKVVTGGI